jgi:endonuclease-3
MARPNGWTRRSSHLRKKLKSKIPVGGAPIAKRGTESPDARIRRAKAILKILRQLYPDANCALDRKSALELLVATVLSAQFTDDRVNKVTPEVFNATSPPRFRKRQARGVEQLIKSTGFFRNKTKNLIGGGKIVERYGGEFHPR